MDSGNFSSPAGDPDPALLQSFKAAAQTVTHLYRESIKLQRRGYLAGYDQCLQDLWQFVSAQRSAAGGAKENLTVTDLVSFFSAKHEALRNAIELSSSADGDAPSQQQTQQQQQQQQRQEDEGQSHQAQQQQQGPQSADSIGSAQQPTSQTTAEHPPPLSREPSQQQQQQPLQPTNVIPSAAATSPYDQQPHLPSSDFTFVPPPLHPLYGSSQQHAGQQQQQRQAIGRPYGLIPPHLAPAMQGMTTPQQQQAMNGFGNGLQPANDPTSFQSQQELGGGIGGAASLLKRRWTPSGNGIGGGANGGGGGGAPNGGGPIFNWTEPFGAEPAYKRSRWRRDEKQDRNDMSD
ncbi:uncharacterized protein EV422DRAFT_539858 [Fimicolochytrium jonesii]|uniref:uncharacterized protein n=1 Tax=Fimicolochytrium jonesii TaxID=1396493 RepID=UPI0022FDCB5D|nr:uncharacterized protein EV422DRAFT_539858 [Fimicolochytrium jonesii]KAI8817761.1 hypothetical protein EV422DRAFT_539858 [Fimicolochytrium jonesii]